MCAGDEAAISRPVLREPMRLVLMSVLTGASGTRDDARLLLLGRGGVRLTLRGVQVSCTMDACFWLALSIMHAMRRGAGHTCEGGQRYI